MDPISIIITIVNTARTIHEAVEQFKGTKERWADLRSAISSVANILNGTVKGILPVIQKDPTRTSQFVDHLRDMDAFLKRIYVHLNKMIQRSLVWRFVRAADDEKKLLDWQGQLASKLSVLQLAISTQSFLNNEGDRRAAQEASRGLERLASVQKDKFMAEKNKQLRARQTRLVGRQDHLIEAQMESAARLAAPASIARTPQISMPSGVLEIPLCDVFCDEKIDLQLGHMGELYRGRWDGKSVFLKLVRGHASQEVHRQFVRDMQTMTKLQHPNIVRLYGGSIEPSGLCLVMEQATLSDSNFFSLPLDRRVRMLRDLLEGLMYMHQKGVKHANICLEAVGLGCYGAAQWIDVSWVKTDVLGLGSVGVTQEVSVWQAPEVRGMRAAITYASDVYSFGWLMWTLYMGRMPFSGRNQTPEELRAYILRNAQEEIPPECPYREMIRRAWALDPAERPSLAEIKSLLSSGDTLTGEEHFLRAKEAERAGDMDAAMSGYAAAMQQGYYKAMTRLGVCYLKDPGLASNPESVKKAQKYFEDAIYLGQHHLAYYNLGRMYEKGMIESEYPEDDVVQAYENAKENSKPDDAEHALYVEKLEKIKTLTRSVAGAM